VQEDEFQGPSGACIPQPRSAIVAPGKYEAVIVAELRTVNPTLVLEGGSQELSGSRIPLLRGVVTPGEYATVVMAELCPFNRA
jgi:hypothetical protein